MTDPIAPAEVVEELKPGYQTSEFWQSIIAILIPNVISVLVLFKAVPAELSGTLTTAATSIIGGIITLYVAIKYNQYRVDLKKSFMEQKTTRMRFMSEERRARNIKA